jgi:hypothetical protein
VQLHKTIRVDYPAPEQVRQLAPGYVAPGVEVASRDWLANHGYRIDLYSRHRSSQCGMISSASAVSGRRGIRCFPNRVPPDILLGLHGSVHLTAWAIRTGVDDSYIFLRYARNIWDALAVFTTASGWRLPLPL